MSRLLHLKNIDSLTDGYRGVLELSSYFNPLASNELHDLAPAGNGEPVLVMPGFGGGDSSTILLRRYLKDRGYRPYGWNYHVNLGPNQKTIEHIDQRLDQIHHENNGHKVALIGHSLGGVYARIWANKTPGQVSRVITLGSPVNHSDETSTLPIVRHVFQRLNPDVDIEELSEMCKVSPDIPTTSIYTRYDGVVHWRTSIDDDIPENARVDYVEVSNSGKGPRNLFNVYKRSSHVGLGVANPVAFFVIADRMAQDPKNWRPFSPERHPAVRSYFPDVPTHLQAGLRV